MRIQRKSVAAVLFALFASLLVGSASAAPEPSGKMVPLTDEILYSQQYAVFERTDEFLLVSTNRANSLISTLDTETGEPRRVAAPPYPHRAAALLEDTVFLVDSTMQFSEATGSLVASSTLISCNLSDGKYSRRALAGLFVENPGDFAVDSLGNYYFIDRGDRAIVRSYTPKLSRGPDYPCNTAASSILIGEDGLTLYACLQDGGAVAFDTSQTGVPTGESAMQFSGSTMRTLPGGLICDGIGDIYAGWTDGYQFRTFSTPSLVCGFGGTVASYSDAFSILLLDSSTGAPVKQVQTAQLPGSSILASAGGKLMLLSEVEETITAELYSWENAVPVAPQQFFLESGAFTATPAGRPASEVTDVWEINLHADFLRIGERGLPSLTITDLDTGAVYKREYPNTLDLLDGRLRFLPPEPMLPNRYRILLEQLYTPLGVPAELCYEIDLQQTESENPAPSTPGELQSDVYCILRTNSGDILCGVSPGTTVAALRRGLTGEGTLSFYNASGREVSSGVLGSGGAVRLFQNGVCVDSLTLIVFGDLTGEGNVNSLDQRALINHLLGETPLEGAALYAADIDHDGKADTVDLLALSRAITGKYDIQQEL